MIIQTPGSGNPIHLGTAAAQRVNQQHPSRAGGEFLVQNTWRRNKRLGVEHEDFFFHLVCLTRNWVSPYTYFKKHEEDYDLALGFGVQYILHKPFTNSYAVQEFRKFKHTLFPCRALKCSSGSGSMHISIEPPEHTRDCYCYCAAERAHMGTNKWLRYS